MGILSMTLTHFRSNDWADSSTGKQEHNGLTAFGKDVVREMNRIGMIVDISHVSDKTFGSEPTLEPVARADWTTRGDSAKAFEMCF